MTGRRSRPVKTQRARDPLAPRLPASLEPATLPDHDLHDEAALSGLLVGLRVPDRGAEAVDVDRCLLRGADLSRTSLARSAFRDCLMETANLANLQAVTSSMLRVRLTDCRLTGLHWVDGSLREVLFRRCRADLSVFRFTSFRHVSFVDCNLSGADFMHADLTGASFVDCDLSRAQFSQATMEGARLRNCELAGIGGVTSFRGAVLAGQDLVALSHTLAAALGIRIDDESP